MARPFDFQDSTKREAFMRQWNLCAHCGRSLVNLYDHAHHVVPNQMGNAADPAHDWIRGVDNCVVLCDSCHDRVHENGRYRSGAVAPPEYYAYSHGHLSNEHQAWLLRMNGRFWNT